jgi:hypothetical protein
MRPAEIKSAGLSGVPTASRPRDKIVLLYAKTGDKSIEGFSPWARPLAAAIWGYYSRSPGKLQQIPANPSPFPSSSAKFLAGLGA